MSHVREILKKMEIQKYIPQRGWTYSFFIIRSNVCIGNLHVRILFPCFLFHPKCVMSRNDFDNLIIRHGAPTTKLQSIVLADPLNYPPPPNIYDEHARISTLDTRDRMQFLSVLSFCPGEDLHERTCFIESGIPRITGAFKTIRNKPSWGIVTRI